MRGARSKSSDKWNETAAKDMKTKITVLTLCAMLFALCVSAEAQQTGKSLPHRFPGSKHCFR